MHVTHPTRSNIQVSVLTLCLTLVSCGDKPTLDPPTVRWGQDVCTECGMILSDDRYAAAVVTIVEGERHEYLYDDPGEMLAHAPEVNGVTKRWVCDMQTHQWIDASTAHYVRSGRLHTPMGYGVVAFANLQDAEALRDETEGVLLTQRDFSGTAPLGRDTSDEQPHQATPR